MKKVIIIDYGLGNLYSIQQACIHVGYNPIITRDRNEILNADKLILPGVGAFNVAMKSLEDTGIVDAIIQYTNSGKPLMGVCLGMQLLFETSEEFGQHNGLGLIKGKVRRFPSEYNGQKLRIPNIGWCRITPSDISWNSTPLKGLDEVNNHMYFIHSYYVSPLLPENVLAKSSYSGLEFTSAVVNKNIWGFQFHPEKSGEEGILIYKNFLEL